MSKAIVRTTIGHAETVCIPVLVDGAPVEKVQAISMAYPEVFKCEMCNFAVHNGIAVHLVGGGKIAVCRECFVASFLQIPH